MTDMKGSKDLTITFEPEGRKVRVAPGVTILQAANEADVDIGSGCSGKGICGKCKVIVRDKGAATKLVANEMEHLSSWEINLGYRLACCAILRRNTVVVVPRESRVRKRKIQIAGQERRVPREPLIKKFHVVLPKPTL